jgi:hypothetical protein
MGPWWVRQVAVFGSISPTSSNGAALWLTDFRQWNSITANPSLQSFLAQGIGPIVSSRLDGLAWAAGNFLVVICSVVLLPFVLVGALARIRSRAFAPWFVYTAILFFGATFLYPVHVPGGAFIHSAIGLAPHAAILSVEGILLLVSWIAGRRRRWEEGTAGSIIVWAVVGITVATGVGLGIPVQRHWDAVRQPRIALAAELDRLAIPKTDRLLSIDASSTRYWTGRPGVVTPDDPLGTIEAVARAYEIRWLVIEKEKPVPALAPILAGGERPGWIGAPVFTVRPEPPVLSPAANNPLLLALYPVCTTTADTRCR